MNQLAICVGAQKAGTSWLFRCLQEHPDVCCAPQKEIHYFSSDNYTQNNSAYLEHFSGCSDRKVLFESSTSYLSHPDAAERIYRDFPEAKIIILLRQPIDRTFSHFNHQQQRGRINPEISVLEAVETHPELLENSRYQKHLSQFQEIFTAEQMLVLDFANIARHPQAIINQVCSFLEIS
ncbi:sulfotransferase, partial [Candidatus Pacebacteria bacterium]|nr:sulfotransferase [Candidatus Paceibacterota bacterium]